MSNNVALFPVSTEEDLLFELVFPGIDLSARSFRVEVAERSSHTVKATLTLGVGLTLIGTDRIRARVAKASMSAWTQNIEYTADLVETTGGINATLVQVRVQYAQPGRLPGSASLGNAATIQIVANTATVISYSGPAVNIGAALAENVEFTPYGGVSATDVQAAIQELDDEKAPKASPTFTGTPAAPTPPTADSSTRLATTAMVQAAIVAYVSANNLMRPMGGINCSTNPNYPAADAGETYWATFAGRIGGGSGPRMEVGDAILCIADGSASGNHATVGANWIIIQANIDGAVIGPASATDGHIPQFDGATGKLLKDGLALDTDGTLAGNSDTALASQKAGKTYADTKLAKAGGALTGALDWAASATVASASTADIGAATSNLVQITGTTTITALGTAAASVWRWVRFAGALTLTHNASSLILPGGANITTAAGDTMLAVSEGSGNWRVWAYQPAVGYSRRVASTTIGRLARFTDTAGGMGQSAMSEDGSGNVAIPVGKLGVGKTATYALDVLCAAGTTGFQLSDGTYGTFAIDFSATYGIRFGSAAGSPIHFQSNSIVGLTIGTTGKVGVNNLAPSAYQFSVVSAAGNAQDGIQVKNANNGASASASLFLEGAIANSSIQFNLWANSGAPYGQMLAASALSAMYYDAPNAHIWRSAAATEWGRLGASGLGVGTSTPNKTSATRAVTLNVPNATDYAAYELASNEVWRAQWFANSSVMGFRSNGIALQFDYGAGPNFTFGSGGLATNVSFSAPIVQMPQGSLALVNGANQNASKPAYSSIRITGPTGAFSIGGLTGGSDGIEAELINTTAQQLTLNNEDASSTAGNRITTDTGANLNCKHAVLRYDATATRWRVISYRT